MINIEKLEFIIKKNAKLFNMKLIKREQMPLTIADDYHLSAIIENEIFSWDIQMGISLIDMNLVSIKMFLHPIVINNRTRTSFIEFANAANLYLGSSLGKFWVNSDNDFCYETSLPIFFLDYTKELEEQLFDKPFSHFRDCLSPLMMLKDEKWTAEKAIKFLNNLKEVGFVENSEYGLW